jgi:hypothetical protein
VLRVTKEMKCVKSDERDEMWESDERDEMWESDEDE